jgi:hypothetical protein
MPRGVLITQRLLKGHTVIPQRRAEVTQYWPSYARRLYRASVAPGLGIHSRAVTYVDPTRLTAAPMWRNLNQSDFAT